MQILWVWGRRGIAAAALHVSDFAGAAWGKSAKVQNCTTQRKSSARVDGRRGKNAMSRKRTQTLEGLTDSAVTWFFVGLMLIAAIAFLTSRRSGWSRLTKVRMRRSR